MIGKEQSKRRRHGRRRWRRLRNAAGQAGKTVPAAETTPPTAGDVRRKPSYQEQRRLEAEKQELAELPERIEALEAEQSALSAEMATPAFYQQDSAQITVRVEHLKSLEES